MTDIRSITDFKHLLEYLCDELGWNIDPDLSEEELTFDYDPVELGIIDKREQETIKIKQLRPLVEMAEKWPWGIFYIDLTHSRLPVVLLRRILKQFVSKKRNISPDQPVWNMEDLIFVNFFGENQERGMSIVHFNQKDKDLPVLKVIAWDQYDTERHIKAVQDSLDKLRWPKDTFNISQWRELWSSAFRIEHKYVIKKSEELARELAKSAKRIRQHIVSMFKLEVDTGPLHKLFNDFKNVLIHDISSNAFADMYAQTISYGLFSSKCVNDRELNIEDIVSEIPETNPFLKALLKQCLNIDKIKGSCTDLEELGVIELLELLNSVDTKAIKDDFGRQKKGEDPVIHLYEGFMDEYDKEQKFARGEFYTPDPVVSFIMRSVDCILKDKFCCKLGLADTVTWKELIDKKIIDKPKWVDVRTKEGKDFVNQPFVQILDPATGTGTFIKHAIHKIYENINCSTSDKWNEYISESLLTRLNGFELKMSPYSVAHLKIGMELQDTGYEFKDGKRLNLFMCNALEEPNKSYGELFMQELGYEARCADEVKKMVPITIIVGNPPYAVSTANKGEYIEKLIACYKDAVKSEVNIMPLADDYIKFIRFAHNKIETTNCGLIGMITNNSYLAGVIHRGMREELLKTFNQIYIVNLHGNSRISEVCPDGSKDENVFDIMQGVSIVFLYMNEADKEKTIKYWDVYGTRSNKYDCLIDLKFSEIKWVDIYPQAPYYFFVDRDYSLQAEYDKFKKIDDIFYLNSSGVKTSRDHFAVAFKKETIVERLEQFIDEGNKTNLISEHFKIKDTRDWKLQEARNKMRKEGIVDNLILEYDYRPFDYRYLYYSLNIIEQDRYKVMRNFFKDNIGLVVNRLCNKMPYTYAFITDKISDIHLISDINYIFPLFNYSEDLLSKSINKTSNIKNEIKEEIAEILGMLKNDAELDYRIISYIYALLYCRGYRNRYEEQLKNEFPRIPFVKDQKLFFALAQKGRYLIDLHLMKTHTDSYYITTLNSGSNFVVKVKYNPQEQKVYINDKQYFTNIRNDIWEFKIGSYVVLDKWLKERKKNKLTNEEVDLFKKIVFVLDKTIVTMQEIDALIPVWPIKQ